MSSPLSLWQELALLALGTLSLSYALLFRVWHAQALVADGVFALAVAILFCAIATPTLFEGAGARIVAWSPLPQALGEADERAAALAALPGRLIDSALERLGFDPDDTDETNSADETSAGTDAPTAEAGWLTRQVRPSVDGLVALLVRVATGTTATLILVLALLLRITTGLARRLRRIGERLEALETANEELEAPRDRALREVEPA